MENSTTLHYKLVIISGQSLRSLIGPLLILGTCKGNERSPSRKSELMNSNLHEYTQTPTKRRSGTPVIRDFIKVTFLRLIAQFTLYSLPYIDRTSTSGCNTSNKDGVVHCRKRMSKNNRSKTNTLAGDRQARRHI